ncbi:MULTISPECIES: GreA/GreB family elongation factor [unclassified Pseudonocardia]|uniref:GreA/GreB family elongation factor n=1 Tax=unclassified Pseudonocardia TaxID=2619320 RepID=UPI00095A7D35|nr:MULTISPECIES: GreA/GreB family elongation factor [unclassified Pseudonocardia]MBN9096665.1 GreA/GreB family elongation factor [Pseudonocardia sp.]OJY38819.1 MAG: hypothetical protein BGP03_03520 [Pseudonocardia sp. 73-21]
MPTDAPDTWLSGETHDRARIELALLLVRRNTGSHQGNHDLERRPARIRKLQELLRTAAAGREPPDDGIAEPGMVLTVRYEADDLTETFLMADHEDATSGLLPVCSSRSPLGAALCGAAPGQQRAYPLPGGDTMTVTMVAAVPYRNWRRPRRT